MSFPFHDPQVLSPPFPSGSQIFLLTILLWVPVENIPSLQSFGSWIGLSRVEVKTVLTTAPSTKERVRIKESREGAAPRALQGPKLKKRWVGSLREDAGTAPT